MSEEESKKQFLTPKEFAALSGLSYSTILRLIKRKKVKVVPHLRHKRIPRGELTKWETGLF